MTIAHTLDGAQDGEHHRPQCHGGEMSLPGATRRAIEETKVLRVGQAVQQLNREVQDGHV